MGQHHFQFFISGTFSICIPIHFARNLAKMEREFMNKRSYLIASLLCLVALVLRFQQVLAHEEITVGDYTL